MRFRNAVTVAMLIVPLTLGGCGLLSSAEPAVPSATPEPVGGPGWLVSASGNATASPSAARGIGTRTPLLPPVSFLPMDPACTALATVASPLIAMTIVPGKRSLTVTWARQYDSDYRITAVPQSLVAGAQATPTWKNVPAPAGCTVTATISGLTSGAPYVVWLDAPNTGYEPDGTRHPYTGQSDVVYPA